MINVFIVEDDPMVLEVNKNFLEKLSSFQLIGNAMSGNEALKLLKKEPIDLVLLDIYLPDISGVELLYEIRKLDIPADVIAITAARDAETVHQLFRLGTVDYLVKPFRFERFKAAMENYNRMWSNLQNTQAVSQEDIDAWNRKKQTLPIEPLPKGLNETTLKQIVLALLEQKEAITAEQLAQYLGMARVTVRRYLEYLECQKQVEVGMEYGRVGRPTHFYSMITNKDHKDQKKH